MVVVAEGVSCLRLYTSLAFKILLQLLCTTLYHSASFSGFKNPPQPLCTTLYHSASFSSFKNPLCPTPILASQTLCPFAHCQGISPWNSNQRIGTFVVVYALTFHANQRQFLFVIVFYFTIYVLSKEEFLSILAVKITSKLIVAGLSTTIHWSFQWLADALDTLDTPADKNASAEGVADADVANSSEESVTFVTTNRLAETWHVATVQRLL